MTIQQRELIIRARLAEIKRQRLALERECVALGSELWDLEYGRTLPGGLQAARGIDTSGNGKVKNESD